MKHKERKELAEEIKEVMPDVFNFLLDDTAKRTRKNKRQILAELKEKFKKYRR